ncbi:DUF3221 domain-containing protein [Metabacillus sp. 84]|uniref:DUF3221 domain-containing protein n=1 Tax=unclassified Metabacillus TaxID=2675274 RepID=UPI003CF6D07F
MRRLKYFFIISSLFFLLFGCNSNDSQDISKKLQNPSDDRTLAGVAYKGKEGTWLIEDAKEVNLEGYDLEKVRKVFPKVIGINNGSKGVQSGDKIKIWYDFIRESTPPKTNVLKYQIY